MPNNWESAHHTSTFSTDTARTLCTLAVVLRRLGSVYQEPSETHPSFMVRVMIRLLENFPSKYDSSNFPPLTMKRKYDEYSRISPDASIALVGLRGVGKSTIGVVVSTALRRRLVDQNLYFLSKLGSIEQYVSTHGWAKYCDMQAEILREILSENEHDAVIVCSSECVERKAGRDLLHEWCREHPVIHIVRPAEEVAMSMKKTEAKEQLKQLALKREPLYHRISNYELYNWRDTDAQLPLKKIEQHVLRLLNFIFQTETPRFGKGGVESKAYTYIQSLKGDLEELDLEELETAVEAFQLEVDNITI